MLRFKWVRHALALFSVSTFSVAHADGWQYTQWGMTPDQVLTASGGKVRPISPDLIKGKSFVGTVCVYEQDFTAGSLELHASLCFDKGTGGLSKVSVSPQNEDCPRVSQVLQQKYGAAFRTEKSSISTDTYWKDSDGDTVILLLEFSTDIGGGCQINYDAAHSREALGL